MEMRHFKVSAMPVLVLAATVFVVLGVLPGCGPGFPIVTAEQEAQTKKVNYLLKENSEIKREMGKARADTNAAMDVLREEISIIRGRLEEKEFDTDRMKETLDSLEETLNAFLGESLGSINDTLDTLKNSLESMDGEVAELKESQRSIDVAMDEFRESERSIDERLSRLEVRPIQKEKKEETPDPATLYMEGYHDTMDKNFTGAMETFERFLAQFPDHELADNAQYWMGEIYYARGDWERAILEFDKVVKKYPAGDKVADSLLKQGYSFEKLGDMKTAKILLRRVVEEFPQSETAKRAKERLEEKK
jgi:tol-pal system protein YbgF